MTLTALTDEQLCRLVGEGDGEALAALHGRHAPFVRGLARRRLRDAGRADDLVQEIFLDVWRGAARFDPDKARFTTWLRTIAARRLTDADRRAAVRPQLAAYDAPEQETPDDADATLQRIDVARALAELPAPQRSTLRMAFWDGLTYA